MRLWWSYRCFSQEESYWVNVSTITQGNDKQRLDMAYGLYLSICRLSITLCFDTARMFRSLLKFLPFRSVKYTRLFRSILFCLYECFFLFKFTLLNRFLTQVTVSDVAKRQYISVTWHHAGRKPNKLLYHSANQFLEFRNDKLSRIATTITQLWTADLL